MINSIKKKLNFFKKQEKFEQTIINTPIKVKKVIGYEGNHNFNETFKHIFNEIRR